MRVRFVLVVEVIFPILIITIVRPTTAFAERVNMAFFKKHIENLANRKLKGGFRTEHKVVVRPIVLFIALRRIRTTAVYGIGLQHLRDMKEEPATSFVFFLA